MSNMNQYFNDTWTSLKSPRVVALLKVGAATVALIHAIDELLHTPKAPHSRPVGFRTEKR